MKDYGLIRQIQELQRSINTAEIIPTDSVQTSDTVKIGSQVTVSIKRSIKGEVKIRSFCLTGNFGDTNSKCVSVNSPMGECIIGKKVGFEGKYTVNGNDVFIKIESISN